MRKEVHAQILVNSLSWQGRLGTLMLSAVPTGLEILASVPTEQNAHLQESGNAPVEVGNHVPLLSTCSIEYPSEQ